MEYKHNGEFVVSQEQIVIIKDEIEELFKRVENIEKQIKEDKEEQIKQIIEDKEEQIKKLKAELAYTKFNCTLPTMGDPMKI